MAGGRIPEEDIAAIRERTPIEDVVGEYVQLKPAGYDSLKGLSPFKDEKTPSFHVRPQKGYYHCFSTGKGGDVFTFLMEMEGLSFPEAVEACAQRIGYTINYQGGGAGRREEPGTRQRLIAINKAAHEFYREQFTTPAAAPAREFLENRHFTAEHMDTFGCGYAPDGWDTLTKHLLRRGFEVDELIAAGVTAHGRRGPIDRFHRRLIWPIKNTSNDVIGFGARKLFDDDQLGKYMNTPETLLYKKSKVLFGIDLAKREIAKQHACVVVEGYTDVMAMHAAGVTNVVAACGTAFGADHLQLIRRLMLDDSHAQSRIIYTFDGDEAGQKAAMRAFAGEQEFVGQSFVAVAPGGMDPCDIRIKYGDAAVRDLVATHEPMVEFVLRTVFKDFELTSIGGRRAAVEAAAEVLAQIKDPAILKDAQQVVAKWSGQSIEDVESALRVALRQVRSRGRNRRNTQPRPHVQHPERVVPLTPELMPQREALKLALQEPAAVGEHFNRLPQECFTNEAYLAIAKAIHAAGACQPDVSGAGWIDAVAKEAGHAWLVELISELAVEPLQNSRQPLSLYGVQVPTRLEADWIRDQINILKAAMERRKTSDPVYPELFARLMTLEKYHRALEERYAKYLEL